jgi:alpha-beta hydrolase superfamily lysophospholipase
MVPTGSREAHPMPPRPGRPRTRPRRVVPLILALAVGAALAPACTSDDGWRAGALTAERVLQDRSFYDWSAQDLDGEPGTLVRAERILGAPAGTVAWRILYRSRTVGDEPVVVSGVALAPSGPAGRPRPVVSWGHPTTGAAQHCAPSLGVDPFDLIEGARQLVRDGDVVVATDYPGMGARGPWSYLIGDAEGRSMLDAARAVRRIPRAGAGDQLLLWGHSQGGHAALFAAREAPRYAPELRLRAVAVAAPAVELGALLDDDIGDSSGVALGSYAFWAYDRVYGARPGGPALHQILTGAGVDSTPAMASMCLIGQHDALHRIADPLVGRYLARNPATVPSWTSVLDENTPTAQRYGAPVFVAQGQADHLVRPATTARYVADLCAAGQRVWFHRLAGVGHLMVAERSLPQVREFFADALRDGVSRNTC